MAGKFLTVRWQSCSAAEYLHFLSIPGLLQCLDFFPDDDHVYL
jgi:hypothetical protein